MEQQRNSSEQPRVLVAFGFIWLPETYEVERDVATNSVAIMSLISVIANAILVLIIYKDPFKKLRTITAILLAFNSAANLGNSLVLFLDNVFYWCDGELSPELIVYLGVFTSTLYFIGNLLHTVNIYGAIVVPVPYAVLAPKVRKILIKCLSFTWLIVLLIIIIPPYTLPKDKVGSYVKALLTLVCVLLGLLAFVFSYLYIKIFRTLYARREKLALSFHLKRATARGRTIHRKNNEIVKTLFIHVLVFLITTVPGSLIFIIFLYCTTCDPIKLQLAGLFAFPFCYTSLLVHPFLWLFRLKNYKQAMFETLAFWKKRSDTASISGTLDRRSESAMDFL